MSFGNLAFPKPLELSPRPWLGKGEEAGQALAGREAAAVSHCPGPQGLRVGRGLGRPHAHADTGSEVSDGPRTHILHVKVSS